MTTTTDTMTTTTSRVPDEIFRTDDDRHIAGLEAAAAAAVSAAIAAAGGIPEGWEYLSRIETAPTWGERQRGAIPVVLGVTVRRPATRGVAYGYETAQIVSKKISTPTFTESYESVNERAKAVAAAAEACSGREQQTRVVSGNYAGGDYTVTVGEWAVDSGGKRVAYRRIDGNRRGDWEEVA